MFTTYLPPFFYNLTTEKKILSSRLFPNHAHPLEVSKETAIFWLKLAHKYDLATAHQYDDNSMEVSFKFGNALHILTDEIRKLWQLFPDKPTVPAPTAPNQPNYCRIPAEITKLKNGIIQAKFTTESHSFFPSNFTRIDEDQARFWHYFARQYDAEFEQYPNNHDIDFTISMTWSREELYRLLITEICQLWQLIDSANHVQMNIDQAINAQRQQASLQTWFRNQHKLGQPADLQLLTQQGINIHHADFSRNPLQSFHGGK